MSKRTSPAGRVFAAEVLAKIEDTHRLHGKSLKSFLIDEVASIADRPNKRGDAFLPPRRHGGLDLMPDIDFALGADGTFVSVGRRLGKSRGNADYLGIELEGNFAEAEMRTFANHVSIDSIALSATFTGADVHKAIEKAVRAVSALAPAPPESKLLPHQKAAVEQARLQWKDRTPFLTEFMCHPAPYVPPPPAPYGVSGRHSIASKHPPSYGVYSYAMSDTMRTAELMRKRAASLDPIMAPEGTEVAGQKPYRPRTRDAFEDEDV
jgi:hypothetical protein